MTDEEKKDYIQELIYDMQDPQCMILEKDKLEFFMNKVLEKGLAEGRKEVELDKTITQIAVDKAVERIETLKKEKADLQQRLDWAQGFLDKDVEYDELNKLRKENAELKEYIKKYNKHNMLCFAADMVYKSLNPKSSMCTPNCVYIKIESELEKWELSK